MRRQQIVSLDSDAGKLAQAYREAKSMVEKRPQSGFAHFTLSYVLRYAALSKEAAQECDLALRLDPGNYQFRSCASVFFTTGQYDHAREFLKLDAGSEWSNNVEVHDSTARRQDERSIAAIAPLAGELIFSHACSGSLLRRSSSPGISPTSAAVPRRRFSPTTILNPSSARQAPSTLAWGMPSPHDS